MSTIYSKPESFYEVVYSQAQIIMYNLSKFRWGIVMVLLIMRFWWIIAISAAFHIIGTYIMKENDKTNLQMALDEINEKLRTGKITQIHYQELLEQIVELQYKIYNK